MDRVFAEMDRRLDEMRQSLRASTPDWMDGRRGTAVDLHETDDGYVLYADLPGFELDEIDLTVDDDVLALDAVHDVEAEEYARTRRVHEQVTLPAGVTTDDVTAVYRNGVLEVSLPVADDVDDGRSVPIED